jgi:DNA-binding MarR family transcriptional regulator
VIVFNPGVTPTALAEAEQVSAPTVSRALKELDGQGLIERRATPDDRRSQTLFPTPKGKRRLENGRKARVARLARALGKLPAADRVALERAVRALGSLSDL